MADQEYEWIQRRASEQARGVTRRLAHNIMLRELQICRETLGIDDQTKARMTNDAEMFLRMGYGADEMLLITCADGPEECVYRLYPRNALLLTGRERHD